MGGGDKSPTDFFTEMMAEGSFFLKFWFDKCDEATQAEILAALEVDVMFADHAEAKAWLLD